MQEAAILSGLLQHDRKAFDSLYDQLFPHVLIFCQKITRDENEAEDITIDCFARLWERLKDEQVHFERFDQLRAYLYTAAKNDSLKFLRSLKAQKNYSDFIKHSHLQQDHELSIRRYTQEAHAWEKLFDEINRLPEKCQAVFKLCYFSGMNRSQVAEQLGLSKHTVDAHCKTAIHKLKMVFSPEELLFLSFLIASCSLN